MYLAIRYYQVDPDSVEEVIQRVNEGFVPTVSNAPGFLAYYVLSLFPPHMHNLNKEL